MNKKAGAADEGIGEFIIGLFLIVIGILIVLWVGVTDTEHSIDLSEVLVDEAQFRRELNQVLLSPIDSANPEINNVYDAFTILHYLEGDERKQLENKIQEKMYAFFRSREQGCVSIAVKNVETNYNRRFYSTAETKHCDNTDEDIEPIIIFDINNKKTTLKFAID